MRVCTYGIGAVRPCTARGLRLNAGKREPKRAGRAAV
jgi:hypothetical protein